eukprot:CAMPEP_0184018006 /NCGR_PEP_ID=MMETSP0954-20121128/7881_1 /TAXON_ID=627963 /ORGANISM="Aplanochytrium sp, Strain PBS07" /LENGTH=338 /DNA_ID=CAMNT_0026299363 /DNA_START=500 /DNA_END=1513 /DNA_ORIENTATION=-
MERAKLPIRWFNDFETSLPSMEGKTVVITGTTSGTGFVAAGVMAKKGANVVVLNRKSARAENSLTELRKQNPQGKIQWIECDLQSFQSVRRAAGEIKDLYSETGIDVLCNNAGIMGMMDKATGDGYDVQIQTNHLSHFLLTKELFPLLQKAALAHGEARVVNHSSEARNLPFTSLNAKYFEKNGGNLGGNSSSFIWNFLSGGGRWERYHQSKLANSVFSQELARKIRESGLDVKSLCCHPGYAITALQETSNADGGLGHGIFERFLERNVAQTQEDGTMPLLLSMAGTDVKNGEMYGPENGMKGPPKRCNPGRLTTVEAGKMLWEVSETACGNFDFHS